MRTIAIAGLALAVAAASGCGGEEPAEKGTARGRPAADERKAEPEAAPEKAPKEEKAVKSDIEARLEKFATIEIGVDADRVPKEHRPVIAKLIEAARIMDRLFLEQVAEENPKWREKIAADPGQKGTLAYFDIMYGPWDRLAHNEPFWGEKEKPAGATFYPEDLTREEIEKWIADHPDQKEAFTGYFTAIERDGDGLKAVPYSEAYAEKLGPAAALLDEAADLSSDARLKKFLEARAKAFRDNEYRQSDMDWMDLGDGDIEVVIGPYEVYEDELMGYKAAFEAFVTLRDPEDSKELARIKSYIPAMEAYLPIPDEHKNPNRGAESPISVVDVLFTGGDTRAGVQTLAFNLPNDEVVREKKGSKKVMLKNVAHAKYDEILIPIAKRLMRADQVEKISFEAFFNHTLVHETAHGLGPGKITVERDGKKVETTVNEELKERYSAVEETKADILGTYLDYMLIEKGMIEPGFEESMYASLLGGFFRSVRFGANEAHGKANLIQLNWFLEKGAVVVEDGRYVYLSEKMKEAVRSLAREVLMIEALGDYEAAGRLVEKYGAMPDGLADALAGCDDIPTDIRPVYTVEAQMASW